MIVVASLHEIGYSDLGEVGQCNWIYSLVISFATLLLDTS